MRRFADLYRNFQNLNRKFLSGEIEFTFTIRSEEFQDYFIDFWYFIEDLEFQFLFILLFNLSY
jgi:hypothetical protein